MPPWAAARSAIPTATQQHRGNGLTVELGGDAVRSGAGGGGGPAEGIGRLLALLILLLMFGSVLAATLPLITAVFAVGTSVGLIALLSHWLTVPSYASSLMILVGLGVGIDYALLVFSRFRTELLAGVDRDVAVRTALDTAGRSVLVAGLTVMFALGGLLALGLASLQGVALAVALTVLVTMVASLTLLPSLLSLFGRRIEKAVRRRQNRAHRHTGSRWRAWAHWVCRHRWPAIVAGAALLVALAAPVFGMRLGIADAGTDAAGSTSRAAYDLVAAGFGPGVNGPLVVLRQGSDGSGEQARQALSATTGVAMVSPAQELADRSGALLYVIPTTAPQDAATADLVQRLRSDVLPGLRDATGDTYLVGGTPAAIADFAAAVSQRLPYFVAAVIGLSCVLLMLAFGSVAIPVKAAVLNVLSIGASLGVVTLVFQHGWFGVQSGPIEAFVPIMIFAIVFGLSMDYEVFLIARMHEEWGQRSDAQAAIVEGVGSTGGVITAAASIMVAVFASFLLSPDRMLQQFGLGLAAAVFLDALVIRCLLVPTLMSLLGERAWWLPAGLRRTLPSVTLEPATLTTGRLEGVRVTPP